MSFSDILAALDGKQFYFVGIKGTGMTALAELMSAKGAGIQGSDVEDRFFTDDLLEAIGIETQSFNSHIPSGVTAVVFSTAYSPEIHPQLIQAQEMGLPLIPYHEALGAFSTQSRSVAVTGVHGKTTTTAMIGTLIQQTALSVSVLVGSGVKNFGGKAVHIQGNAYFVAEACEYQRHFLHFSPSILIITSIEADHLDYFRDRADVLSAFLSLAHKLPQGGRVLYCADQDGAVELVQSLAIQRRDIEIIPYGLEATGPFRIQFRGLSQGYQVFSLANSLQEYRLPIPGRHNVLNAGAAIALVCLLGEEKGQSLNQQWYKGLALGLEDFKSTRRRSEIVHMSAELVVIDDYGHHPTAVKATLSGYREFYPGRRLILSFMHHTYSRTKALYQDWLGVFDEADIVLTHPIYSSAREEKDPTVSGAQFARDLSERHPAVVYFEQFDSAAEWLSKNCRPGDVLITMGAGDNWKVGQLLIKTIGRKEFS